MKKNALLLFLCMLAQYAYAQVVAIQSDKMNIVYICLENPVTIAAGNCPLSALLITTDNGEIIADQAKGAGHYLIKPSKTGREEVTIKKKLKNGKQEVIGNMMFRVRKMPSIYAVIGRKPDGSFSKQMICEQTELLTLTPDYNIGTPYIIDGYTIVVYRDSQEVYKRNITGNKIDNETILFFYTLNDLDRVVFKDITVKDCVDKTTLPEMHFIITDADEFRKRK